MTDDLEPGDAIRLSGIAAEVVRTYSVGDLDYLRAYVEDAGVKTVCIDDVAIEPTRDRLGELEWNRRRPTDCVPTTRRSPPSGSISAPGRSDSGPPTSRDSS